MLDVHEQQLLVLLLVVQAELDQAPTSAATVTVDQELGHRLVDVAAVGADLRHAGSGDQAPVGPGVPLPTVS